MRGRAIGSRRRDVISRRAAFSLVNAEGGGIMGGPDGRARSKGGDIRKVAPAQPCFGPAALNRLILRAVVTNDERATSHGRCNKPCQVP
jgi:hypothetical protein